MSKLSYIATFAILISCIHNSTSQNYRATLKDSTSNEIIPYASISYASNKGIITNEEGKFNLDLSTIFQDSIYVSSVGYLQKGFAVNNLKDSIIYLKEDIENLDLVYLTKENYTAKEIMELVEKNIDSNYQTTISNQKIFYRQTYITTINKLKMDMKESSIPTINKNLIDSINGLIPRKSDFYQEILGNYYVDADNVKLRISKAAELYDKDINLSMEGISKKLEKILNDNIKSTSYLKIKSGIFGSKVQVDSILADNKESKEIKDKLKAKDSATLAKNSKKRLGYIKSSIKRLNASLFYAEDPTFNLIDKLNKYQYTLKGFTIANNEPCYIINFEPKGSKEFKGTLHINVNDFAIVQMDYKNVKNLKDFSMFGISYSNNLYKSKVFFRKENLSYIPYFIQLDKGMDFGIKRPLTIIEKNKKVKGRRKQNEVALKIDVKINSFERFEYLVYETNEITTEEFEKITENTEFEPTHLQKYDAEFWADETIIEPNKAIQNFSIQE